ALNPVLPSGFTQPSTVRPDVRSSELASGTETKEFVPLNDRALPNLPLADQVALLRVPLLWLPDWSAVVVPLPSSKPQAPPRPAPGGGPPAPVRLARCDGALAFPGGSAGTSL